MPSKKLVQARKDHEDWLKSKGWHQSQIRDKFKRDGNSSLSKPDLSTAPNPTSNVVGAGPQAPKKVYSGTQIIGIATMHKSNAVPVTSKQAAVDIAKMRKG